MPLAASPLLFDKTLHLLADAELPAQFVQPGPFRFGIDVDAGPVGKPAAAYLGVSAGEAGFRLSQVKAEFLLVEVFSMYCPYCQAEARNVNALYGLLQKSKAAGAIRMLGIGAGNTPFEVDFFRDKYQAPFPLFPDQEFACHQALSGPGTPYFMLLKADGAGGFTVLHSHLGAFGDPGKFLDTLLAKAGLR